MIITFAWTTPALLAGAKTVTRRLWTDDYARKFHVGDMVQAYDRNPRQYGQCVAVLQIESVTYEADADAPDSDYEAEGFAWLAEHPEEYPKSRAAELRVTVTRHAYNVWRQAGGSQWVIRFKVISRVRGYQAASRSNPAQEALL